MFNPVLYIILPIYISPVWFCIFKQLSCEKLYKTAITLYSHCSLKIGQGICKYDSLLIYIFLLYFYQLWKQTMFVLLCFTAMQPSLEQTDFCLRDSQWLIMFSSVEFCSVGGVSISWFVLQSHSMVESLDSGQGRNRAWWMYGYIMNSNGTDTTRNVGNTAEVEKVQKNCNWVKVSLLCLNCTQSKSKITHLEMYSSKSTKLLHLKCNE